MLDLFFVDTILVVVVVVVVDVFFFFFLFDSCLVFPPSLTLFYGGACRRPFPLSQSQ